MGTFSGLDAAMRMRQIITQQAAAVATDAVPTTLVGRFTQVDLDNMKGMCWFPGDDEPTEVTLLPGAIPASWNSGGTSMVGYGSTALVQEISGKLYALQILTGGSFSVDTSVAGFGIRAERPGSRGYGNDPLSDVYEFYANLDLPDEGITYYEGEALIFGPFVTRNVVTGLQDDEFGGFLKIALSHRDQVTRLYETVISANDLSSSGGWMRIQPYQEISYDGTENDRFELDVRRYTNGEVVDTNGDPVPAFYFRIVNGFNFTSDFPFKVAIHAGGLFNYARTGGFRNRITTVYDEYPEDHKGYVGFHSSGLSYSNVIGIRDSFHKAPRAPGTGWGPTTGDSSIVWQHNSTLSYYRTDGYYGWLNVPVTGSPVYSQLPSSAKDREFEFGFDVQPGASLATGANFEVMAFARWDVPTINAYKFAVSFNTDGTIQCFIMKLIAGVQTTLASLTLTDLPTPAYNSDANHNLFKMKVRCVGTSLKMNVWKWDWTDEQNWKLEITDSSITAAGVMGVAAARPPANTNNNLRIYFYNYVESVQTMVTPGTATWNTGPYRSSRLRAATDLQKSLNSSGTVKLDGNYLSWIEPIELSGIGIHPDILSEARAYISQPTTATDINSIPQFPSYAGFTANAPVTGSGVFLPAGHSLYCAIPPGYPNMDLMKYLFVVNSNELNFYDYPVPIPASFSLPEWAVLIASRTPGGVLKTGMGIDPEFNGGGDVLAMAPGNNAIMRNLSSFNITTTTFATNGNSFTNAKLRRNARYKYELRVGYTMTGTTPRARFQWAYLGTAGYGSPSTHDGFVYGNGQDNTAVQDRVTSMYNARRDGTGIATLGSFSTASSGTLSLNSSFWSHGYIATGNLPVDLQLQYAIETAGQTLIINPGSYLYVTRIS
jgi:hypothetical protein